MKSRGSLILFIGVAIIVAVVALCMREPRYHGRTLTSWLQQIYDPPWDETQRVQAEEAIRAIGAKKALPKLLNLVKAEDDPVSLWIIDKSKTLRIDSLKWHTAEEFQQLGIYGFVALGTNAAPAVGQLTKLLDEPNHANSALACLASVGKLAEAALCRGLTNQDARVRQASVIRLASVTDDIETYIARIKGRIGDSSEFVRSAAVESIGAQTAAPDLTVPLLVDALKDSADLVSCSAAEALANFGTNSLIAVPVLSNLVEHGSLNTANAALASCGAGSNAMPFLVKGLTNQFADVRNEAANNLTGDLGAKFPDQRKQAIPLLVKLLNDPDENVRMNATNELKGIAPDVAAKAGIK